MTSDIFDDKFKRVLWIYENWINRKLSNEEIEISKHFFLQGIAADQLYPELRE